jgi:DnaK suppressor protein
MTSSNETKNEERISPYNDEELEYFKKIILKKRNEADQELTTLQNLLRESMEKCI